MHELNYASKLSVTWIYMYTALLYINFSSGLFWRRMLHNIFTCIRYYNRFTYIVTIKIVMLCTICTVYMCSNVWGRCLSWLTTRRASRVSSRPSRQPARLRQPVATLLGWLQTYRDGEAGECVSVWACVCGYCRVCGLVLYLHVILEMIVAVVI